MKSRLQPVPFLGCLAHAAVAAVAVLMLLTLVACSGGGSGGSGSTTTTTPQSCGDAATCLATFSDAYAGAASAISQAAAGTPGTGGPANCLTWTETSPGAGQYDVTMVFTNCVFGTITVNGNITIDTSATQFSFSSTGFSVVGTANGNAVNFSCSMDVTYVFSPLSISGNVCGTTISYAATILRFTVSLTPSTIAPSTVSQAVVKAFMSDGTYSYPAATFSNNGKGLTSQKGTVFTGVSPGTDTISATYTEPATGTVWTNSAPLTVGASLPIPTPLAGAGTVYSETSVSGANYYEFTGLTASTSYVVAATGMSSDVDLQVSNTAFASLASPCHNLYTGTRPEDCTLLPDANGDIWVEIEDAIGGTTFALTAAPAPTATNSAYPTGTIYSGSIPLAGTVGDSTVDPAGTTFYIYSGTSTTYSVSIVGLTADVNLSGLTAIPPGVVSCLNSGFSGIAPEECTIVGADGLNNGSTSKFAFTVSPGPARVGAGFVIIVTPAPNGG